MLPSITSLFHFYADVQTEVENKKMFLRTASHEIRTPVNTTILNLQFLERELLKSNDYDKSMRELFKDIMDSTETTLDIVNDLLTHDKIKEGKLVLNKTSVNIWELVSTTIKPFLSQVSFYLIDTPTPTSSID